MCFIIGVPIVARAWVTANSLVLLINTTQLHYQRRIAERCAAKDIVSLHEWNKCTGVVVTALVLGPIVELSQHQSLFLVCYSDFLVLCKRSYSQNTPSCGRYTVHTMDMQ